MFTRAWLTDAAERVGSTFAETFLAIFGLQGLVAVAGGHWQAARSLAHVAATAGAAAVLALVKTLLAAKAPGTLSPASLAPRRRRDVGLSAVEVLLIVLIVVVILVLIGALR